MISLGSLVRKYRRKGVLIDANLLICHLIGAWDPGLLRHCRATKGFSSEDFFLLNSFLNQFERHVTTPHVLTEVSNLAGRLPESMHSRFRSVFRAAIERLGEEFKDAKGISKRQEFLRLGITDTAISVIAPGRYLVLTDEVALFGVLHQKGIDAINFNHLRSLSWQ